MTGSDLYAVVYLRQNLGLSNRWLVVNLKVFVFLFFLFLLFKFHVVDVDAFLL